MPRYAVDYKPSRVEFQLLEFDLDIPISDDIQDTISRVMGYHEAAETFKYLRTDGQGRLLVSSAASAVSTATTTSTNVLAAGTTLLAENTARRQYIVYNAGAEAIELFFGNVGVFGNGLPLAAGAYFADDIYVGKLTAICAVGPVGVRLVEM